MREEDERGRGGRGERRAVHTNHRHGISSFPALTVRAIAADSVTSDSKHDIGPSSSHNSTVTTIMATCRQVVVTTALDATSERGAYLDSTPAVLDGVGVVSVHPGGEVTTCTATSTSGRRSTYDNSGIGGARVSAPAHV
jgi:hypothetical protein